MSKIGDQHFLSSFAKNSRELLYEMVVLMLGLGYHKHLEAILIKTFPFLLKHFYKSYRSSWGAVMNDFKKKYHKLTNINEFQQLTTRCWWLDVWAVSIFILFISESYVYSNIYYEFNLDIFILLKNLFIFSCMIFST